MESTPPAHTTRVVVRAEPPPVEALASWNDGAAKDAIVRFVASVTSPGAGYVPPQERVAVFDNDGTLWPEQPVYTQLKFTVDRAKEAVSKRPEWRQQQPFKSLLEDDWKSVAASGESEIEKLLAAVYAGMTTREFEASVMRWISSARHPRFDRLYTELTYQPMLELIDYLRDHDFKVFIVSGGGVDFMRPWAEHIYGVPPERIVGTRIKLQYENSDAPALRRLAGIDFVDDRSGKPVGIQQMIGRRPIAAFGNSDGDFEMLEWTTTGSGPRFGLIIHHTDDVREWAYDRESPIGRLSYTLDAAGARGWTVVDMKHDWRTLYAFQKQ
jgi:phosphoglycolate phosphatase-like HAD superfamily hydrolase